MPHLISSRPQAPRAAPIAQGSILLGMVATLCLPSAVAQDIIKKNDSKKRSGAFPSLSVLPEGSILKRVHLTRYDKDYNATSLLAANLLTVLDNSRIEAEGATIELYGLDGELQARAKMRKAIYNQKESTLNAQEAIYLKGKNYVASGSGLTYHWQTKQGFLSGPASSRFIFKKDTVMNSPSALPLHTRRLQACAILSSFLTLNTSLLADPPAQLTPEQINKLEMLSDSVTHQTTEPRVVTKDQILKETKLSNDANARIKPFLKSINKGTLLIQAPAEPNPKEQPVAEPAPPAPPEKATELQPGESTLLVECDGGLYFDNEAGILAYLKNIRLTEDRFKLTCSNELKVFLDQKPPKDQNNPNAEKKQPDDKTKKDGQASPFGKLKQIIATGSVKVTRLDDQGKPFIAMSETASYNAKTGEIILRGGFPKLQQSANQYLQAQEPGQWVRVLKSGKLVTSNGKWKMVAVLKNR